MDTTGQLQQLSSTYPSYYASIQYPSTSKTTESLSTSQSTSLNELFKALSLAQAEMKGAIKDSVNPFFKSKFADLESVWDACRGPLTKNGLSVIQTTEWMKDIGVVVATTLAHTSGQWIRSYLPVMAAKQDPQSIGSAISYSRRYSLASVVGVYQTDDDGNSAMPPKVQTPSAIEAEINKMLALVTDKVVLDAVKKTVSENKTNPSELLRVLNKLQNIISQEGKK